MINSNFTGADGNEYSWLDSDTITDGATSYRVKGFNALETSKVIKDQDDNVRFIQGQQGGKEQTEATQRIAREGEFNNIEDTGEVDKYGRKLINLKDRYGNDLSNTLYRSGLIDVDKYTTEQGLKAEQAGEMEREANISNRYTDIVNEVVTPGPTYLKDTPFLEQAFGAGPVDENSYAQQVIQVIANQRGLNLENDEDLRAATKILDSGSYDKRSVAFEQLEFRNRDRTKEGVAYDQMTTAWNQGWGGLATGLAGFADLSGVLISSPDLADWAERRVRIAKEDLLEQPRLKSMDYRDIDSVLDGFSFITNNMAMSAPYLVALVSGSVLAPVTGGVSLAVAIGSVGGSYAGQVWNDIEGPKGKKEAGLSILAGTIMSALDYAGMKGFMKPGEFLTKSGREAVIQGLINQGKAVNRQQAKKLIEASTRKAIGEVIDGIGDFALMNVRKPNLMLEMAKGSVRGAATEGVTEALQEGTGYLASKSMSEGGLEKNFDADEFKNLLAQSAVAGSSLGSSFGTAGALFREGQNQVLRNDLKKGNLSKLGEYNKIRTEFAPENVESYEFDIDGNVVLDANGNPKMRTTSYGINDIINGNKEGVDSSFYQSRPNANRLKKLMNVNKKLIFGDRVIGSLSETELEGGVNALTTSLADVQRDIAFLNSKITDKTITTNETTLLNSKRAYKNNLLVNKKALIGEQKQRARGIGAITADQARLMEAKLAQMAAAKKAGNTVYDTVKPDSSVAALKLTGDARKVEEKKNRTFWDKLKNFKEYLPKGYRASSTTVFSPALLRKSEWVRKLSSLVGTALGNIYNGVNVSGYEQILRSNMLENLNPKGTLKFFGMADREGNYQRISDMLRAYVAAKNNGTPLTEEMVKYQVQLEDTINRLNLTLQTVYDQEASLEYMDNPLFIAKQVDLKNPQWLNSGSFDWKKVRQNKSEWLSFMKQNAIGPDGKPFLDSELDKLYNKVSNNEDASDFSIVGGTMWKPNEFRQANGQLLSAHPSFEQFSNTDILQNMIRTVDQYSKYIAYTRYFGRGGQDLDYMFEQMKIEPNGLTDIELEELALGVKDIIDAGTGNYNQIINKKLAFWQRKASFFSAFIGLPLSALASVAEFSMLIYQGPNGSTVRRGIVDAIKEMTGIIKNIENMPQDPALADVPSAPKSNKALQRLSVFGLYNDDAVAATRLGMGETDIAQAWWMKQFFKFTLIAPETVVQRALLGSMVAGVTSDRLRILAAIPEGADMNQRQLEVYNQLADMGMDVNAMVDLYKKYSNPLLGALAPGITKFDVMYDEDYSAITDKPLRDEIQSDTDFVKSQMQIAGWYFINERIQNPQAFNRPLIFQDPHYQLFLQFNGFISNFTSVVIPKLWIDYLKNGSPRMKYNTFALIVLMMALAGLSQWLKDYIKFGGSSPYLTDFQLVQRAVMASGVLGSGERILQAGIPLYKSRDESILDRIFGESIGGAPFVRNVTTAGKALGYFAEGDTRRGISNLTKITPGLAPFTPGRKIINQIYHGDKIEPY
jgi:hypothetical protein